MTKIGFFFIVYGIEFKVEIFWS